MIVGMNVGVLPRLVGACVAMLFSVSASGQVLGAYDSAGAPWSKERVAELMKQFAPEPTVFQFSASSDGESVAFEVEGRVSLLRAGAAEPENLGAGSNPELSPDGRLLAFRTAEGISVRRSSSAADGASEVSRYPVLAANGHSAPVWSSNSRYLAFVEWTLPVQLAVPAGETPYVLSTQDHFPQALYVSLERNTGAYQRIWDRTGLTSKLVMLDTRTGKAEVLAERKGVFECVEWAPNGEWLIASLSDPDVGRGMQPWPQLVTVDRRSRAVTEIPIRNMYSRLAVSPSGKQVAAAYATALSGYARISIITLATREVRELPVTRALMENEVLHWRDERHLVGVFQEGAGTTLLTLDARDGREVSRRDLKAVVRDIAVLASDKGEVRLQSEPGHAIRIVRSTGRQERERWSKPLSSEFLRNVIYRELKWQGADGETVEGILMLPPGTDVSGAGNEPKPPVIFTTYPGTATWAPLRNGSTEMDGLLLARGYALFRINSRGPHVTGAFAARGSPKKHEGSFGVEGVRNLVRDISGGIEKLRETGLVDTKRMCAYGHSNGGATSMQIVTRSSLFDCAIIKSPAFLNFEEAYYLMPGGLPGRVAEYAGGVTPSQAPEVFDGMNPILRAGSVDARVLIITGRNDVIAALNSAKFFTGLHAEKKRAQLLVYPDEPHVFGDGATVDAWWRTIGFIDDVFAGKDPEERVRVGASYPGAVRH